MTNIMKSFYKLEIRSAVNHATLEGPMAYIRKGDSIILQSFTGSKLIIPCVEQVGYISSMNSYYVRVADEVFLLGLLDWRILRHKYLGGGS